MVVTAATRRTSDAPDSNDLPERAGHLSQNCFVVGLSP
jgi:hypothetical protein